MSRTIWTINHILLAYQFKWHWNFPIVLYVCGTSFSYVQLAEVCTVQIVYIHNSIALPITIRRLKSFPPLGIQIAHWRFYYISNILTLNKKKSRSFLSSHLSLNQSLAYTAKIPFSLISYIHVLQRSNALYIQITPRCDGQSPSPPGLFPPKFQSPLSKLLLAFSVLLVQGRCSAHLWRETT